MESAFTVEQSIQTLAHVAVLLAFVGAMCLGFTGLIAIFLAISMRRKGEEGAAAPFTYGVFIIVVAALIIYAVYPHVRAFGGY